MSIYDIIPIENQGMSVITALVLFFMMNGYVVYFWWDRREHSRIQTQSAANISTVDDKVCILFDKVDRTQNDISEINTHIASIQESIEWIKKSMERA